MDMILSAKKQTLFKIIGLSVCFLFMLLFSTAQIYSLRPFGAAFFVALIFCSVPAIALVPFYLICELFIGGYLYLFSALIVCVITVLLNIMFKYSPAKYKIFLLSITAFASCGGVAIMSSFIDFGVFEVAVYASSALLFTLCSYYVCVPIIKEKLQYKLLEFELICFAVFAIVFSYSLSGLFISFVPIIMIVAAFAVCITSRMGGFCRAVVVAFCFGAGASVYYGSIEYVALYAIFAIIGASFVTAPKIIMPLGLIVGYVLATFFFYQEYETVLGCIIALGVGGALYIAVPLSFIELVRSHVFISHERVAVRYMINKLRHDTGVTLNQSANIFSLMSCNILNVESEGVDYSGSLVNKCCCICSNYGRCRGHFHSEAIEVLTNEVLRSGYVSIGILPQFLCDNCMFLTNLMQVANEMGEEHRQIKAQNDAVRTSRLVVSESLTSVSNLLRQLSSKCTTHFESEPQKEKALLSELNYLSIMTAECLIMEDEICLIVRTDSFDRAVIEKAATRVMRRGFKIVKTTDTILSGFCAVSLKAQSKYNVVFAHSSAPKIKGQQSGDTHSFIKLGANRFLLSLCDGMGSGEEAQKASDAAISLVENFYKAGYSHDLVLQSVNKYLTLSGSERFSALDICVIDLECARADIIKLGSPSTYIKMKDSVAKIDSSSAPIGVMDNLSHNIVSVALSAGDSIVLVSDGVTDCFEGDKLSSAINNVRSSNPQILSKSILECTLDNCKNVLKDDTSVVVARIITI